MSNLPIIGEPSQQQKAVNEIVDTTKAIVLQALEETKKEFEQRELTDDQKIIYSDFVVSFATKVTLIGLTVE